MTRITLLATAGAVAVAALAAVGIASGRTDASTSTSCAIGGSSGAIKHVIYLQFDNTHFRRDNPNVASDLEQMPNLLNFMQGNGTLFTNDHTILISHTAGGILSSLTGLYPDRQGQTVSNSYDYYKATGVPQFTSSFKYWTSPVATSDDTTPNMIFDGGKTTPAPWVPYTRAGCDFGGIGTANIELENNSIAANGDICNVYGCPSSQSAESAAQRTTDFVGIAIHCSQASTSVCNGNANAKPDPLPDEPGGYTGFNALFGAKYVNPAITGGGTCVNDTSGNPINGSGTTGCGFPGFDGMLAKNSLGYVAAMQEVGVPVTYAYISDAHDNHTLSRASGPGEADYTAQLQAYNDAFGNFFTDLAAHGIDKSNTLFVVTVDEGDHFAGVQVTPDASGAATYTHTACPQASITAVTPCAANQIGEVNAKIGALLPAGEPAFDIHFDDAPTFYVNNQPARTDPAVRQLERDVANATAPDPYANAVVPISQFLGDTVEEKALHMINTDPLRTPTFVMFGNPDFFFQTTNLSGGCAGSSVCVNPGFAWNHGDVQEEIGNTWVGFVGPGIANNGVDSTTWTDHTNLRPTILSLLGLHDDYVDDGHVLREALNGNVVPDAMKKSGRFVQLSAFYEQLNASFGSFALDTLKASTKALTSTDDAVYTSIENQIESLTTQRDTLAGLIKEALNKAAFDNVPISNSQAGIWVGRAKDLIDQAHELASS
jgi:hypothetical protein